MLAQTRLLVPKVFPNKREAPNSIAKLVIPAQNTAKYKYFFLFPTFEVEFIQLP